MTPAIAVHGLSHAYGATPVIAHLDIIVPSGRVTALLGPTGCGKSTLLRILAGLEAPAAGRVSVLDRPPSPVEPVAAYMPQDDTLLPWRRALDNALIGRRVAGRIDDAQRERAIGLFARFGLRGFERSWPYQLSGGMRQRVALIRTLLPDRPILLLDEPFGALDPVTRADLRDWLRRHVAASGQTVLLVTHDADEALAVADEIVVVSPRPSRVIDQIASRSPGERDDSMDALKRRLLVALGSGRTR